MSSYTEVKRRNKRIQYFNVVSRNISVSCKLIANTHALKKNSVLLSFSKLSFIFYLELQYLQCHLAFLAPSLCCSSQILHLVHTEQLPLIFFQSSHHFHFHFLAVLMTLFHFDYPQMYQHFLLIY